MTGTAAVQDETENPRVLDYGVPPGRPGISAKLDPIAAVALTVGLYGAGTVWTPDPGMMWYRYHVLAGTCGGAVAILLALIALGRLLLRRRGRVLDVVAASAALVCGAMAELGAIVLMTR